MAEIVNQIIKMGDAKDWEAVRKLLEELKSKQK